MVLEVAMNGGVDRWLTFNQRDFKGSDTNPPRC